jgi:hypothetical protein
MRVLALVNDTSAKGLREQLAKKGVQPYAPKPKSMRGLDVTVTTVEGMPVYRLAPTGVHEAPKLQHAWPLLPGLPEGARARCELVELCR